MNLAAATDQLTIAWWLHQKTETPAGVDLAFERAIWWTGGDSDDVPVEVGRQYAFTSDLQPLYEGE